jgi:GrpB-like predicted nucleotidyltransferase (UPF0157 family)
MTPTDHYPPERLVPYDSRWPELYAGFESDLRSLLGDDWDLEHVGSTSVPGLPAKPVIDIAVRMPPGTTDAAAGPRLVTGGWSRPVPVGDHWAATFPATGVRTAIVHLFTAVQWPEAHLRLFAATLRQDPQRRDEYAALKQALVADNVWGPAYTESKGPFVTRTVNQARAAMGLPEVDHPL